MIEIEKKVIAQGASKLIILPKPWCKFWNLTKKSKVTLLADSIIMIIPKTAKVNLQKLKKIMREEIK